MAALDVEHYLAESRDSQDEPAADGAVEVTEPVTTE